MFCTVTVKRVVPLTQMAVGIAVFCTAMFGVPMQTPPSERSSERPSKALASTRRKRNAGGMGAGRLTSISRS